MNAYVDTTWIEKAYSFYLNEINKGHFYVPLNKDQFEQIIHTHTAYVSMSKKQVNGLLIGAVLDQTFYIAYLLGEQTITEKLLKSLESTFEDTNINTISMSFYNPIKVPFYVHNDDIHINAQGVLMGSRLASTLLNMGYLVTSIQDTYHIDVLKFDQTEFIEKEEKILLEKGVTYELIIGTNSKIEQFLEALNNPHFVSSIKQGIERKLPILYVSYKGSIVGFTGPISASDRRGTFGGIELLDTARGLGAGKLLFFKLIEAFKHLGATYTTLFTGRENPSQYIYKKAGAIQMTTFQIVKKELTK